MAKTAPHDSTPSQIDRFKQLARDLECDESEEAFKAKLVKVAKAKGQQKRPSTGS
jgi:hypothetical protein